jgi:hypothetical protein
MKYQVWYMRTEFFGDGILGTKLPNAADLGATHVHLKDIDADGLDRAFCEMQGEIWSPNGEARDLIESKGLAHTSMCVGDVLVDDVGNVHVVSGRGWRVPGNINTR